MAVHARDRILDAALVLGRRDGWSRLTVADVLEESGAARRSLYTHFPGGASEVALAAVTMSAEWITSVVERACEQPVVQALATFVDTWATMLASSQFDLGCPIAAAAAGRPRQPDLADVAADAFGQWEVHIVAALCRDGADQERAERLGTLVVAAVEGAVVQCLAVRSVEPLRRVEHELRWMVESVITAEG